MCSIFPNSNPYNATKGPKPVTDTDGLSASFCLAHRDIEINSARR